MIPAQRIAATLLASVFATVAMAAKPPLNTAELSVCADRVRHLRTQSPLLLKRNADLDRRRDAILARRRALDNHSMTRHEDDLEAGLEIRQQRNALNADARVLNQEIQALRTAIARNSKVRDTYDAECARRPYSRNDFNRLPQPQQDAMRAGLADIQVPELPPNMPPLPGVDAP